VSYDLDALKRELIRDEGTRLTAYRDTLGNWTIGVGHLLRAHELSQFVDAATGKPRKPLSEAECAALLLGDIIDAENNLNRLAPGWRGLDDVRQRAMLNLSFNLGGNLGEFKRFLAAMADDAYDRAANCLIASKWYGQVKTRGPRIVRMIREGKAWGDEG